MTLLGHSGTWFMQAVNTVNLLICWKDYALFRCSMCEDANTVCLCLDIDIWYNTHCVYHSWSEMLNQPECEVCVCVCVCVYLICKMLNNESFIGHPWFFKKSTRLQMSVIQFLSPGVIRALRHLRERERERERDREVVQHMKYRINRIMQLQLHDTVFVCF